MASETVRLRPLEALYRNGGTPTADDVEFLAKGVRETRNSGDAGRLLIAFGERGHVAGYTPRSNRRRVA